MAILRIDREDIGVTIAVTDVNEAYSMERGERAMDPACYSY